MTQISVLTSDVSGTNAGDTAGGLTAARTLPPISLAVAGPALNTSVTATSLLAAAAKAVLPGGFWTVGKAMRITALGVVSNIVTTPGTLTLDVRMGPTSNIVVFNGGALSLNVVAKTNVPFRLDVLLTCRAVGSGTSANLYGTGMFTSESVVGAAAGTALPVALAAGVGTGFDSTVASIVDVFGTFSISNANNGITVHEYALEEVTR